MIDPLAVVGRDDPVADGDVGADVADPPDVGRVGRVGAGEDGAPAPVEPGDAPRRAGRPEVLPVLLERVVPPQGAELGGIDHVISLPPRQTTSSTRPHASAVAPSMTTPLRPSAAARWRPMRRGMLTVPPAPGTRPMPQLGQGDARVGGRGDVGGERRDLDAGAHARPVQVDVDAVGQQVGEAGRAAGQPRDVGRRRIGERTELAEVAAAAERRSVARTAARR